MDKAASLERQVMYPNKAKLPLEQFCEFYFKELGDLSIKKRMDIAYNDAVHTAKGVIYGGKRKRYYRDPNYFFKKYEQVMDEYFKKAYFSRFLARRFLSSGKSPEALMAEEDKRLNPFSIDDPRIMEGLKLFSEIFLS